MGGSVLSFLKAEWKVSDTGSAHWASIWLYLYVQANFIFYCTFMYTIVRPTEDL